MTTTRSRRGRRANRDVPAIKVLLSPESDFGPKAQKLKPKLDKAAEFLDISISELVVRFMSSFTEEQWIEVARKAKP